MSQNQNSGIIHSLFKFEGDTLVHKTTQPTEDLILGRNQELRKNPGSMNDLGGKGDNSWGRQVASIPIIMFEKAIRDGYQLNSKDGKHAEKEMFRYLQSPEGRTCLVRDYAIKPRNKSKDIIRN